MPSSAVKMNEIRINSLINWNNTDGRDSWNGRALNKCILWLARRLGRSLDLMLLGSYCNLEFLISGIQNRRCGTILRKWDETRVRFHPVWIKWPQYSLMPILGFTSMWISWFIPAFASQIIRSWARQGLWNWMWNSFACFISLIFNKIKVKN